MGYRIARAFFYCSEVVAVANKPEKNKGKKKKRKGDKGNIEEGNNIPSDDIYADAGMTISSVHFGSQCD